MANKIVFEDYAVGAKENAHVDSSTQLLNNGVDEYNVDAVLTNTSVYHCVSFDDGGIDLSQPAHIMSSGDNVGFVSAEISGANCTFTNTQSITIVFNDGATPPVPTLHSGNGISLYFNTHYCSSVKVEYFRTGTVAAIADETYNDISSLVAYLPLEVESYDKIVITFLKTKLPYQRAMVSKIDFGQTVEITDFQSIQYHKMIYFDCSDIAIGTLEAKFMFDGELNFYRNQRILFYHSNDDENYELVGTYWISESKHLTKKMYSIVCEDMVSQMDSIQFTPMLFDMVNTWEAYSPIDIAVIIAMLRSIYIGFPDEYSNETLYGWTSYCSARELVARILFSIQCFSKTIPDGRLRVFGLPTAGVTIEPQNILGEATFEKSEKITNVNIGVPIYKKPLSAEYRSVYEGKVSEDGTDIPVDYPVYSDAKIYNNAGAEVTSGYTVDEIENLFSSFVTFHSYGNRYSATTSTYANTEVSVKYPQPVKQEETLSFESVKSYEQQVYDKKYNNVCIRIEDYKTIFEGLANRLFSVKGTVRASYIGDDLDVGDYVTIETKDSGALSGTVTEITGNIGYRDTIQKVVITIWGTQQQNT